MTMEKKECQVHSTSCCLECWYGIAKVIAAIGFTSDGADQNAKSVTPLMFSLSCDEFPR